MLLLISGSWVQIEARFLLPFLKETADVWPNGQKFRQPLSCGGGSELPKFCEGSFLDLNFGPPGGSHTESKPEGNTSSTYML